MKLFPFTTPTATTTTLFLIAVSLVALLGQQQQEPFATAQTNDEAYADNTDLNTTTTDADTVAEVANLENEDGPDAIMIKNETIGNSDSSDGNVSAASTTTSMTSIMVSVAACVVAVVYVAGAVIMTA